MTLYENPSEINLTNNPTGLFNWLNTVTHYWFSNLLILVIGVIIFMGYISVNKDDYFGASSVASYICFVLSLLGWIAGLVSGMTLAVVIGISLVSTALLLSDRRGTA